MPSDGKEILRHAYFHILPVGPPQALYLIAYLWSYFDVKVDSLP